MLRKVYKIFILPYTVFLLYLMFLGFGRTQLDDNIIRMKPIFSTIAFVEYGLLWNQKSQLIINLFGNFFMFVPFGFLGWIFAELQKFKPLMCSFLSVLIIVEATQYFSRMGIFDIDDIMMNSLGVASGFLLSKKIGYYLYKR